MVQLAWIGVNTTNILWQDGENYMAANWSSFLGFAGGRFLYGQFALAKALRLAEPSSVLQFSLRGKDWFLDPVDGLARHLIDLQHPTDGTVGTAVPGLPRSVTPRPGR